VVAQGRVYFGTRGEVEMYGLFELICEALKNVLAGTARQPRQLDSYRQWWISGDLRLSPHGDAERPTGGREYQHWLPPLSKFLQRRAGSTHRDDQIAGDIGRSHLASIGS
jgi:hypothetical protein